MSKFKMRISLNVLDHLGLNLYSNVPAVLSEAVANSWDADAKEVNVDIFADKIVIADNGDGMSETDINEKYLHVGYKRRDQDGKTTKSGRAVMGRKGIGKLSLFSIAKTVTIHTVKDKIKNGFVMSVPGIEKANEDGKDYYPTALSKSDVDLDGNGTRIVLTDLKKRVHQAARFLRKRLARRFSVISLDTETDHEFVVNVNGKRISIDDHDYFDRLQYLWYFGKESEKYLAYCRGKNLDKSKELSGEIEISGSNKSVVGWIGSFKHSTHLTDKDTDDNLNKIAIMVRGKIAQEDILREDREGGLYTNFLRGEIHADFLDTDDKDDIATSSRQEIIKDDPRYKALQEWIVRNLKIIAARRRRLKSEEGGREAKKMIPALEEWLQQLSRKARRQAESLLGKIGQLDLNLEDKIDIYKYSVLAFEKLRYKGSLDTLDRVSAENLEDVAKIFADLDDIESTMYYQIVQERLRIIQKLDQSVEDNVYEAVIRDHLHKHLWLLDPSWDRATETPNKEQNVQKEFNKLKKKDDERDEKLTDEEKSGIFDIKYKKTSGKHVIIELKRPGRTLSQHILMRQISKYRSALRKEIKQTRKSEPIEVVIIVGKPLSEWQDPEEEERSRRAMEQQNTRVVLYGELIADAYRSYQVFLDKNKEAGRVHELIDKIDLSLEADSS